MLSSAENPSPPVEDFPAEGPLAEDLPPQVIDIALGVLIGAADAVLEIAPCATEPMAVQASAALLTRMVCRWLTAVALPAFLVHAATRPSRDCIRRSMRSPHLMRKCSCQSLRNMRDLALRRWRRLCARARAIGRCTSSTCCTHA